MEKEKTSRSLLALTTWPTRWKLNCALSATEITAKVPDECSKVFRVDATLEVAMLPSLRPLVLALLGRSGR